MSLKQEIETWVQALEYYDNQQLEDALRVFDSITDTSKILFNCGVIYATLGEHDRAVACYQRAVSLDQYLAIAYFQEGVSNFLLGDFEEALANFNDTLLYLRGNTSIDYEQLGLKFRLYSCEVLFNRGLCYIYLQQMRPGMQDLEYAAKEKVTADHGVINDAIRERAEGYTVFSIPVGIIYRPNEAKVKNLKTKDYLGKAKLVAASDRSNTPIITQGLEIKRVLDDRSIEGVVSYGTTTTSSPQKSMAGRGRQHSEPPLNRNLFPPTPPPDADKTSSASAHSSSGGSLGASSRSASVRAGRPPRLDLDRLGPSVNGRNGTDTMLPEKPRIGTIRTASEPRGPSSRQYARDIGRQPQYGHGGGGHRRGVSDTGFPPAEEDGYGGEVYYMRPRSTAMNGGRRGMSRQQQGYIDEEEEYSSDPCDEEVAAMNGHGSGGFEIMGPPSQQSSPARSKRGPGPGPRGPSRRPDVRRFRVKVHASEDIRYIMIGPVIEFGEFVAKIREKFGFNSLLKIRMQDEGDMITMVDQEDLDLLLISAKEFARREGSEMGKMEIWVEERTMI